MIEFLAVVGGLSLGAGILSLFFALGRRPSRLEMTEVPRVDSADFLRSVAGAAGVPLRSGGTVELLDNGAFFPALVEAIGGARKSVNFLVFIWEPGKVSDIVFPALIERARAGVEVRLLLDGFGGMKAPAESIQALEAAGGRVARFRPPRFGKLTRFHKRTHRRAIVIDGEIAFTGGAAVGDKWLGNASTEEEWRDTMVRVTGPLAASLQSAFAAPWAHVGGEILTGERFYPAGLPVPAGDAEPKHVGVASSPGSEDHPLRVLFMQTFLAAREKLYITTPYFVPDAVVREAVVKKAREGVDVRILLPDEHTDAKPIRQTSHAYYEELMEAGVRIYEYQPTMMHTKHVVVDGLWVVVGSANMDVRSKELNDENVLGILDAGFGRVVEATFHADLERAREIQLSEWRRRGPWKRLQERVCRILEEQY
jgi:cardiolipin synthase A/B